jgi:hypothetical protein
MGTRQELRRLNANRSFVIGDAKSQKSTQPESLILAQSERWRQA